MQYTMYHNEYRPYIRPQYLKNRNIYIEDIMTLEAIMFEQDKTYSYNDFLHEWAQLLINAIHLFEAGYFDCAYYSLRQAIEMSVLILYFADLPDMDAQAKWKQWYEQKNFPTSSTMLNELKQKGEKFEEMRVVFPEFLSELRLLQGVLNKLVHKQGFFYLYTIHGNSIFIPDQEQNHFIIKFPKYLEQTIHLIAMIRVFIDPYPLLLADPSIAKKSFCMTTAYPNDFITKYLGSDFVERYKKTSLYQSYYEKCIKQTIVRVSEL